MKKMKKFWDQSIAQMVSGMSPPRDDLTFQSDYVYILWDLRSGFKHYMLDIQINFALNSGIGYR